MPSVAASRRASTSADVLVPSWLKDYYECSRRPLTSLWFVLPLLVLHEWGVRHFAAADGGLVEHRVAASTLLLRFFSQWGAYHHHLPALAVVAILLAWHVARKDCWQCNLRHVMGIGVEGVLLAVPLVGVFWLFSTAGPAARDWRLMGCLYVGAGVYEELIFRLMGFALLSLVLMDLGRIPQVLAAPVIVLTGAAGFAAYHTLGGLELPWQAFVFLWLRGVYYGVIYLDRGFGVTVGTHVGYDLAVLCLG